MKTIKTIKNLVLLTSACVTVLLAAGCDKDKDVNKEEEFSLPTIVGTWKLVGLMDAETDELATEFEPKDCKECYTLTFDTEYTAFIRIIINKTARLEIDFSNLNPYEINLNSVLFCEKYDKDGKDYCDSDLFRRSVILTKSYTFTPKELRLYTIKTMRCNYVDDSWNCPSVYLSFKPVKP